METWAYYPSATATPGSFIGNSGGGSYWRKGGGSDLIMTLYKSDCSTYAFWSGPDGEIQTGWHFYSVSIDSSGNMKMYRDGILIKSNTFLALSSSSWDSVCSTADNWIKIGNYASTYGWAGSLDDFKIYNYARTPAQIAWDYNRGKPVGWWKLDEGEGTSAYDSSGNGNTGTLTSMDPATDWVDGKFGKALDFDGSDDYISAGTAPDFVSTQAYSWSAWIKWSSFAKSIQCYFSKDAISPKTTGYNLCLNQTGSTADPIICKGQDLANMSCSTGLNLNMPNNTWINISVVYDGSGNWKIYENGQYMGTETQAVSSDTSAKYFIGAGDNLNSSGNQDPDYFFTGQIDDVRVYNYALTAEQIRQVMNEGSAIRFGE
jgi:hypothetical protein